MTVLASQALANVSDTILVDAAAQQIKAGEAAGMRGILISAIFLKLRGDNDKNAAALFLAFSQVVGEGSAKNYRSKARAAAMPEWFKEYGIGDNPNVNATLDDLVEQAMPHFTKFWGAVNGIKKTGPGAGGKPRGGNKNKEPEEAPLPLKEATVEQVATALAPRLSERKPDAPDLYALDMAALVALRDAVNAEIAKRQAEAAAKFEEEKKAA